VEGLGLLQRGRGRLHEVVLAGGPAEHLAAEHHVFGVRDAFELAPRLHRLEVPAEGADLPVVVHGRVDCITSKEAPGASRRPREQPPTRPPLGSPLRGYRWGRRFAATDGVADSRLSGCRRSTRPPPAGRGWPPGPRTGA